MKLIIKPLIIAAAMTAAASAAAMPPLPGIITTTQPDGTPVELSLRGDEHFSWGVSPDGYTLMRDAQGFWTVAEPADAGMTTLRPSDLRLDGREAAALRPAVAPGLKLEFRENPRSRRAPLKVQLEKSFPTTGKRNMLMLLVNFADTRTTYKPADFDAFMNAGNYRGVGSFRDYYLENSYGVLDIMTTVTRWVTLPNNKAYYNVDNVPEMIRYALNELSSEIDLRKFDNDGDGVIDGIALIHQGTGQEASGQGSDIWSHSSIVYGMEVDGVAVGRYTCQPEILATTGGMSTIGVMVHEFGHNLGAPDFYDTDYSSSGGDYPGTGVWDLMGSGAWNGEYGNRPAGINMWQKIQYGWVNPVSLESDTTVSAMPGSTFRPVAYRFDTTVPGEYFIVENRLREGAFDSALPGEGVLIYHVDESLISNTIDANTLNVTYPQAMYTVSAGASENPTDYPGSYGPADMAPFPGARNKTEFSDTTFPSTQSNSGRYAYRGLRNIALDENDGSASFDFFTSDVPPTPYDLSATALRGDVSLAWKMPEGATWNSFNIYRNGRMIAQTTWPEFTDRAPSETRLTYEVDAVAANGLISPCATASLRMPANRVSSVSATAEGGKVKLAWDLDSRLTRMESDFSTDRFTLVEHTVRSADFVHRFRAEDLAAYAGCRVKRIGFCPYLGPQEAAYTVRVWEADADGSNPVVVSERQVKEFGAKIWNNILLTKQVEIKPGKELWFGIHIATTRANVQMLGDAETPVDGFGNLMRLDGGDWEPDHWIQGNYYLSAEISAAPSATTSPVTELSDIASPDLDLNYPAGFRIYRDDQPIGTSSTRLFVDSNVADGRHTYGVASLYKGWNESAPTLADEVTVDRTSAEMTGRDDQPFKVTTLADGRIAIEGASGALTVADVTGRRVFSTADAPARLELSLPRGIYIVRSGARALKTAVGKR